MKLYLSSFRLGDNPERLRDLLSTNTKTAVIVNAIDDATEHVRTQKLDSEFKDLSSIGIPAEELDLRHYFDRKDELKRKTHEYGLVWIRGGNSFILRRAMYESGFDEILKEKAEDKDFVYAGYSAAICVVTPTLKGIELVDDPTIIPMRYNSDIIWNGLGFINYSVAPHYRTPQHPETHLIEKSVEYFMKHNMPYKTLQDGEVIIVQ